MVGDYLEVIVEEVTKVVWKVVQEEEVSNISIHQLLKFHVYKYFVQIRCLHEYYKV